MLGVFRLIETIARTTSTTTTTATTAAATYSSARNASPSERSGLSIYSR